MPRGGKCPGAGAPKGNLNAVKTGRYSKRLRTVASALNSVPELRDFFLEFQRRQRRGNRKAARIAYRALLEFIASVPDANNPIVSYLRHALRNEENGNKNFE